MRGGLFALIAILFIGYLAYSDVLYLTGAEYYDVCWDKFDAERKRAIGDEAPTPANARQAAIWKSCEVLGNRGAALAGVIFAGGDADAKLLEACPGIAVALGGAWNLLIKKMEEAGGSNFIDKVSPAEWTLRRVATEVWPHCSEERERHGLAKYDFDEVKSNPCKR